MYALKEHVDVEFNVKPDERSTSAVPSKKGRARGTAGRTNGAKKAPPAAVPTEGGVKKEQREERTPVQESKEQHHSTETKLDAPASPSKSASGKNLKGGAAAGGAIKPYPNRPKSAANPSKRYDAGKAFVNKQELPWNYDLALENRDLLTLERDAYIQSKRAAKEKKEKKVGVREVHTSDMEKITSRTRPVKAVAGTALNGSSKTIFAIVNQKEQNTLNNSTGGRSSSKSSTPGSADKPKALIDKYKVNRTETGIHSSPWDSSELPPERTEKEIRLLPTLASRLVPMKSDDNHFDTSYRNRSALQARESVASVEDAFGRVLVRGIDSVKKEMSISNVPEGY
jgi:hypothetical protein